MKGHNLPDNNGNRYCINLVSISGNPAGFAAATAAAAAAAAGSSEDKSDSAKAKAIKYARKYVSHVVWHIPASRIPWLGISSFQDAAGSGKKRK